MFHDDILKQTVPIIKSFPHSQFNIIQEELFLESISVESDEVREFQKVNNINPKPQNLICIAGYLYTLDDIELDIYAIYSYDDKIHFLTINIDSINYTYDFLNKSWVEWTD